MKYIKYVWYAIVAFSALGLFGIVGPKVYDQVQYQFFNPDGDSSMWPATFEGLLILISIPVTALALMICLKEKGSTAYRLAYGILAVALLVFWVYGALLWQQSTSSYFQQSLVNRMISNDGALIILVGVVFHLVFAVTGSGFAAWFNHYINRLKNKSEPDGAGQRR